MNEKLNLLYEIKDIRSILKDIEKRLGNIEDEILDKNILLSREHDCDDIVNKDKRLNIDNIWNDAKDIIKCELTEVSFNTWIKPIISSLYLLYISYTLLVIHKALQYL